MKGKEIGDTKELPNQSCRRIENHFTLCTKLIRTQRVRSLTNEIIYFFICKMKEEVLNNVCYVIL